MTHLQAAGLIYGFVAGYASVSNRDIALVIAHQLLNALSSDDTERSPLLKRVNTGENTLALVSALPIGYVYQDDAPQIRATIIAHTTAPDVTAARLTLAYMVKLAFDNVPPASYLPLVMPFCEGWSDDVEHALRRIGHVLAWGSQVKARAHIGSGADAASIVALTLYNIMKYPDDYELAVQCAIQANENAALIAGFTGAMLGARLGLESIPPSQRDPFTQDIQAISVDYISRTRKISTN